MKKSVAILIILITAAMRSGLAQEDTTISIHVFARYSTGVIAGSEYANDNFPSYSMYGLTTELMVFDHIGLIYNIDLALREDDIQQLHYSIGIGLSVLMVLDDMENYADPYLDGDTNLLTWGSLALITLFIPDGISYHYSPSYGWDIVPYINFAGLDMVFDKAVETSSVKYAYSFGLRGTRILKETVTVSAFTEVKGTTHYSWGVGGGVAIGVLW